MDQPYAAYATAVVCDHGQLARSCDLCERDAELARLQRIEAAARAVLDAGLPARGIPAVQGDPSPWIGDLVPAAEMRALRAAVEGVDSGGGGGLESPQIGLESSGAGNEGWA